MKVTLICQKKTHRNNRRHLESTKLATATLTAICVYLLVGKLPTCNPVHAVKMADIKNKMLRSAKLDINGKSRLARGSSADLTSYLKV
jgi:hypothetical protein